MQTPNCFLQLQSAGLYFSHQKKEKVRKAHFLPFKACLFVVVHTSSVYTPLGKL
jgi:hypothetical protein